MAGWKRGGGSGEGRVVYVVALSRGAPKIVWANLDSCPVAD